MAARTKVFVDIATKTESSNKSLIKYAALAGGAAVAIAGLVKIGKELINTYAVQEKAEAKLNAALKATGEFSVDTANELKNYASELQGVTTFGDEATISSLALLQQLSDLDKDGLKKVIPGVQDFAVAMGMDLDSAASLVGKTLGSSTNALARYGIEIDATAPKEEKLIQLTEALNDKFGGTAKAVADTATGSLKQLSNVSGDLQESLGGLAAFGLQPFAEAMTPLIADMSTWLSKMLEAKKITRDLKDGTLDQEVGLQDLKDTLVVINDKYNKQLRAAGGVTQKVRDQKLMLEGLIAAYGVEDTFLTRAIDKNTQRQNVIDGNNEALSEYTKIVYDSLTPEEKRLTYLQGEIDRLVQLKSEAKALGEDWSGLESLLIALLKEKNELLTEESDTVDKLAEAELKAFNDRTLGIEGATAAIVNYHIERAKGAEKEKQDLQDIIALYSGPLASAFSSFSALAQVGSTNEIQAIDAKIKALEEEGESTDELEAKKRALLEKNWKINKAASLASAVVNTAEAITSALKYGPVYAALVGAAGAAQVAAIAGQEMPAFATGGSFVANGPTPIMTGEGATAERVTVEPISGNDSGGMQSMVLSIDGQQFSAWMQNKLDNGGLRIPRRIVV